MTQVYSKSPKGLLEITGKTSELDPELREVLRACKDNQTADEIAAAWPGEDRPVIVWAVGELVSLGYLREVFELRRDEPAPASAEAGAAPDGAAAERLRAGLAARREQRDAQALDYIRQGEQEAHRRAEEQARKEAEQQAQIDAARAAEDKVRRDAEDKARREAVDRIRREAMEKMRRDEEEKLRREAEEKARREAEEAERIRREAEEQARREAEEQARLEAEERARIEAEERLRREEEERVRREAEERARRKAEEQARREAEERARLEEEERDRERIRERLAERKLKRSRQARIVGVLLLLVLPVAALFLVRLLPFDGKRQAFETAASAALGVPVKAGAAHVELLPQARLTLDNVVVGGGEDSVRVRRVSLAAPFSVLWSMPAEFGGLQLDEPQVPPALLPRLVTAAAAGKLPLKSGRIAVRGLVLTTTPAYLPPLAGEATLAEGRLETITARGEDGEFGTVTLAAQRSGETLKLDLAVQRFLLPVASKLRLRDFSLAANLAADRLTIGDFKGWFNDGEFSGNGTLAWQDGWRLVGKLAVKRMDAAATAPGWLSEGFFNGQGDILAIAPKAPDLLGRAQIQAQVAMERGVLAKVDLDRVVQGRGQGERFSFESLTGSFGYDAGRIDLSDIRLTAGELAATGSVSVGTDQTARGRLVIDVRSGRSRFGGSLTIGGTATAPSYQR